MKFSAAHFVVILCLNYDHGVTGISHVPSELLDSYKLRDELHIMLIMNEDVSRIYDSLGQRDFKDSAEKTTAMVDELREFTQASQEDVIGFLKQRESTGEVTPFWITNKISVKGMKLSALEEVIQAHGHKISDAREAVVITLDDPIAEMEEFVQVKSEPGSWGIHNINVPKAHAAGYTGQGIVVGLMDSGVRWTHDILKENNRKTYFWYDAQNQSSQPIDTNGHGSHCTGTAVGRSGYGVAPGATWIHCRIFAGRSASEDVILTCGQWITCPTLPDGSQRDCSKKPNVCSNSWGGGRDSTHFNDVVNAWRNADIIPVFAIGNAGSRCRTALSPGDQPNLISVGATDLHNNIAKFSSRGPSRSLKNKLMKPEISAPGFRIMSASIKGDSWYAVYSGTSMACPHVAGAVAVLLSKRPTASFDQISAALQNSAYRNPSFSHIETCNVAGANITTAWPNNVQGFGIIRLDAALEAL